MWGLRISRRALHSTFTPLYSLRSLSTLPPPSVATPLSSTSSPPLSSITSSSPSPSSSSSSPSAVPSCSSLSDAGSEFILMTAEEEARHKRDDEDRRRRANAPPTFRRNLVLFGSLAYFLYTIYDGKSEAEKKHHMTIISCQPEEVMELSYNLHLTSQDLVSIYANTMRQYKFGRVRLDEFIHNIIIPQVQIIAERRKRERERNKAEREHQRYLRERKEVVLEIEIERNAPQKEEKMKLLQEMISKHKQLEKEDEQIERVEASEAKADEEYYTKTLNPLHFFIFFRCSPYEYVSPYLEVREIMNGLSLLVEDKHKLEEKLTYIYQEEDKYWKKPLSYLLSPWRTIKYVMYRMFNHTNNNENMNIQTYYTEELEKAAKERMDKYDLSQFLRVADSRLSLAFRVADEDKDGALTFEELQKFLTRCLRTGHITSKSIIRPNTTIPYTLTTANIDSIVQAYWEEHQQMIIRQKRAQHEQQSIQTSNASATPFSVPYYQSYDFEAIKASKISYQDFLSISRNLTVREEICNFWYLIPTTYEGRKYGMIKSFTTKWKARWQARFYKEFLYQQQEQEENKTIQVILSSM